MTLPGQKIIGGVSNYLFGSNAPPDYTTGDQTWHKVAKIQQYAKSANLQLMRCGVARTSPDSLLDSLVAACKASGCAMLMILHKPNYATSATENQHIVQYLGSFCNLYEYGNEPDLDSTLTRQQYIDGWNKEVPQYRKLNPNAAFIGPTLGDSSHTAWMQDFMTQSQKAGVIPDGISYHIYPCTGNWTSTQCMSRSAGFSNSTTTYRNMAQSTYGKVLSMCITEWNLDASSTNSYADPTSTNAAYIAQWTANAFADMVKAGVDMANQFDFANNSGSRSGTSGLDDLISTTSLSPQAQYQPFVDAVKKYLGSGANTGGGGTTSAPTQTSRSTALRLIVKETHPKIDINSRFHLALAQDSFNRPLVKGVTSGAGWGTTSDALSYTMSGTAATLSTDGTHGLIAAPSGGSYILLGSGKEADVGLTFTMTPQAVKDELGFILRYQDTSNWIRMRYVDGTGLVIDRNVKGTLTSLNTQTFTMTLNTAYRLRAYAKGQLLQLKGWADGTPEPSGYTASISDTGAPTAAGQYGIYANPSSSTTIIVDNFYVSNPVQSITGGTTTGSGGGTTSGGGGTSGGPATSVVHPLGLGVFALARLGDGLSSKLKPAPTSLGVSYNITLSKYVQPLQVGYTIQKKDTAPLLLYYVITPPSQFAINGDGSIISPDHVTYTPTTVANHSLIGSPLLQGYKSMTWSWAVLRQKEYKQIISYYNPQNPIVLLTYPDEYGNWTQREAVMRPPPSMGEQQQMMVYNLSLTFTRL